MSPNDTLPPLPQQARVEYRGLPGCPAYRVSSTGDVQSCLARLPGLKGRWAIGDKWKTRCTCTDDDGRPCVSIRNNGRTRTFRVCRLVLLAFVGPCPPGHEVCHRNGDPADNRAENLYWGTHTDNMADRTRHGNCPRGMRHARAKLTEDDVRLMRSLNREGWRRIDLSRRFKVTPQAVASVLSGQTWSHVK